MTDGAAPVGAIRIDKWLWHARFFKSRTLAARAIAEGAVRVNGTRIDKPARALVPGDVLTFAQGGGVRVVRVLAPGFRRGPAPEAASLYHDLGSGGGSPGPGTDNQPSPPTLAPDAGPDGGDRRHDPNQHL